MVSGDGTVIVLETKLIWMVYDCAVHRLSGDVRLRPASAAQSRRSVSLKM